MLRDDSDNPLNVLHVPIARPNLCLREREKKWHLPFVHKWPSIACVPKAETFKANLKGRPEKNLPPRWSWLVQINLLSTQDGNDLKAQVPASPDLSNTVRAPPVGVVQMLLPRTEDFCPTSCVTSGLLTWRRGYYLTPTQEGMMGNLLSTQPLEDQLGHCIGFLQDPRSL